MKKRQLKQSVVREEQNLSLTAVNPTQVFPFRVWSRATKMTYIFHRYWRKLAMYFPAVSSTLQDHIAEWLGWVELGKLEWSKFSQGMCRSLEEPFLSPAIDLHQTDIQEEIRLHSPPRSSPLFRSID